MLRPSIPGAARPLAVGLPLLATPALAADDLWSVFERRCLLPYEHVMLPDRRGLTRDGDAWIGDAPFVLTTTASSCAISGGVVADLGPLLASRLEYVPVGDGLWQSTTWREPRIEVEALEDGYLVRETDLEA